MLISYKWLQSYFEEKLPPAEKLAELITFGFAEMEKMEQKGDDTVFDIKVLPDRACYALSHRGVAYEVFAITGLPRKVFSWPQPEIMKTRLLEVRVEAPELCSRYTARVVEQVTQKEMPWVAEHLEAVGQRSINPVVDGANIVMLDRGQPLHAFDADKVRGGIVVRRARNGEKMITLDTREVALDESVLIIADDEGPLAIAGIKGGKKVEVTVSTKNLILESASFDPSHIRKTSERLGIKTDASKRFENRLSPEMASAGMSDFTAYLFEMDKNIRTGEVVEWYPDKARDVKLKVKKEDITRKLGISLSGEEIEVVFARLEIVFEKTEDGWTLTPPVFRMDLTIPEDITEEVGRIIGYGKIPSEIPLTKGGARVGEGGGCFEIPRPFYYEWKIREMLVGAGFSEVMTSSFSERGDIAIEKPLAEDKRYARANLREGFEKVLKINALNAPLFGTDEVRLFEIGKVFPKRGEHSALALGVSGPKKKAAGVLAEARETLSRSLGVALVGEERDGVFECNLDSVFETLPSPTVWDISLPVARVAKFLPFSLYPFIVRDIALFVQVGTEPDSVNQCILKETGSLVVCSRLFDSFKKDGRISYAFRLVFQSFDRTLMDTEVNAVMEKIYAILKTKGFEVR